MKQERKLHTIGRTKKTLGSTIMVIPMLMRNHIGIDFEDIVILEDVTDADGSRWLKITKQ